MAASAPARSPLLQRLPEARGELRADAPLAKATWFQVGGPAEVLFRPRDLEDLETFLKLKPADVPLTVLGAGTNVLVRDGGIDGVVVRLGKSFADIAVQGDQIVAGAAAMDVSVARAAAAAGISGMEFLSGVPGTIGGAIRMNAGAYGRELGDIIVSAEAVGSDGQRRVFSSSGLGLGYRECAVPDSWIFVSATLRGATDAKGTIESKMSAVQAARTESQPIRSKTGGSTFANPAESEADGAKAWQLIDQAGCRGLQRGDAMVSNLHCNFLINNGAASAADLEALGEEVRRRVAEATGIVLRWEIRRIGNHVHGLAARDLPGEGGTT
tara:strand:- start:326 stop:1306 length:981 start_codon:yes stop_codon:yes gene_type:complete